MGIGGGSQREVGKGEERSALCAVSGIEMLLRKDHTRLAVSLSDFYQFYTSLAGKTVFLEKFLWSHVFFGQ